MSCCLRGGLSRQLVGGPVELESGMARRKRNPAMRDQVRLIAVDSAGAIVHEQILSRDEYYENLHPMIDDNEYIRTKRIRQVDGEVFDSLGRIDQAFTNLYDETGRIRRSRAVYADGTIQDQDFPA
jgi:hypothetical protein